MDDQHTVDNGAEKKPYRYEKINLPPDTVIKAKEGDALTQLKLGKAYYNETSIGNNYNIAFEWTRLSAEQGNMEAQFRLGDMYALGFGATKNLSDSYKWYTKAAIQGYKKALIRIHNLYQMDIKMHCRGQLNSKEEEWASDDFKKENNIRELYEYRLEQNKSVLSNIIEYFTHKFKHYQSSDQNNVDVQLNLAFLYQHGYGTKKCSRWAFEYYALAAEQGNTDAQYNLGYLYQQYTRKKFNYREAFKWYSKSAQGGNIAAQRCLAYFYLKGLATDINYEVAISWYLKAAESGDSQAQITLGMLYRKGDCVKQDLSTAVKWYTLAAQQGSIVAQNCIVQLHRRGMLIDVELDEDISEYIRDGLVSSRLYTKLSAEASKIKNSTESKQLNKLIKHALIGDGQAMYEIGLKYYIGSDGFPIDKDTGIKWIKNAAKKEHKNARLMMASLYSEGNSVEQDYQKSYIWNRKIAKQKDANAQCQIGIMYKRGLGVRKDPLEASKWFTWAIDQENSDAQFYFGMLRLHGNGIRENKKEAEEWLYKSVLQRNILACHTLGKLYFDGEFNTKEKNYTMTGLKLLEFAAKYSDVDAQVDLGFIYKSEKYIQHDVPKSIEYYTMAAGSDDERAQYELAIMYLDGNKINQDYIEAYNLFKKAGNSGNKNASKLFETPIVYDANIENYSNVLNMFIEVTEKGFDDLSYNLGSIFEQSDSDIVGIDINYTEAEKWYLRASTKGDSRADYRLGLMYEFGIGLKKNYSLAIKYYKNAVQKQNSDAIYRLAFIYLNKDNTSNDYLEIFYLFTNASTMGCINATKALKILEYDEYVICNPDNFEEYSYFTIIKKKLISMMKSATKKGDAQSQYQLGVLYDRNNSFSKAFKWLSLAAGIGVTDAYYRLGVMYEEGRGVEQNYKIAANMYQKATEKDHEDARFRLGQLYLYGNGVERDILKAYHFYKKAAEMGHEMAERVLNITLETKVQSNGSIKEKCFAPLSKKYLDSFTMCKFVAEHGDPELQFKVGFAYEYSFSDPNYNEAFKWYSMAAKTSYTEAVYHLGLLYEKGLGIPQDYHKANQLYNQAYRLGSNDAVHRLGTIYHHGKGVEIDPIKAIECYTLSAELGNPKYQCKLGRLYEEDNLVQKNLLQALKWYTKAYLQGYEGIGSRLYDMYDDKPYESYFYKNLFRNLSVASLNYFSLNDKYEFKRLGRINDRLGLMLFFGIGTDKNLKKSFEYFMKEYSDIPSTSITEFPLFEYSDFGFSQKINILKEFADDDECRDCFTPDNLYTLGMVFYDGKIEQQYFNFDDEKNIYTLIDEQDLNDLRQHNLIKKDYSSAFNYIKRAANKTHPEALFQLGIMYYCGDGVQKSSDEGDRYFDLIPLDDPKLAAYMAMLCHTHNDINILSKAFIFYNHLEKILADGSSLPKDDRRKINELVQTGMGPLYEYGDGVKQDYQKAIEYYKKLVDNGDKSGCLRLALMYYYGKGVPVDYKKAWDLIQQSYNGIIYFNGVPYVYYEENKLQTSDHVDYSKRNRIYCIKTEEEIDGEINYYQGLMYKHGQCVEKDEDLAQRYFKDALEQGCLRAANEIKEDLLY